MLLLQWYGEETSKQITLKVVATTNLCTRASRTCRVESMYALTFRKYAEQLFVDINIAHDAAALHVAKRLLDELQHALAARTNHLLVQFYGFLKRCWSVALFLC